MSNIVKKGSELCSIENKANYLLNNIKLKKSLVNRLNRIEGQVRGIKGMIEKDAYCDDVLNQITAVTAAMNSISKLVFEYHIRNCVTEKIRNEEAGIVDEFIVTIDKMLK